MNIKFSTQNVTFNDITVSNGEVRKEISHTFETDIREGSATLSSFFIAYPSESDRRQVEFVSARVANIRIEGAKMTCTIILGLEDGGSEETGGEVSPTRSYADVLFIADCE